MMNDERAGQRRLHVVHAVGDARTCGRIHGETLRTTIADGIAAWRASIERRHGLAADAYVDEFLGATAFLPTIERWAPRALDEVRGIAEGASQPFPLMLAYNLMDEEWAYGAGRHTGMGPGCTAIALLLGEERVPVIAQTMDLPAVHDGTQTVLTLEPTDQPAQFVFTAAGMLGLNGANAAGIGVVVNNLAVLPSSRTGLPVMFMVRGILSQTTLADACAFVQAAPHAIGQHYLIGGSDGVASYEASAAGVVRIPLPEAGRFAHANHPLLADPIPGDHEAEYRSTNTRARQQQAEDLLPGLCGRRDVETLLSDLNAPISRAPQRGGMTFGATSIVCSAPPVIRIAPGPPHSEAFVDVPAVDGRR